jgi:hypothetical protein
MARGEQSARPETPFELTTTAPPAPPAGRFGFWRRPREERLAFVPGRSMWPRRLGIPAGMHRMAQAIGVA